MKDRITLGHEADVAETAALTLADNCATERIFAALDWEREEKSRKGQINNAIRRLAKKDRPFARSVLKGKRWEEMGISKQAATKLCHNAEDKLARALEQRGLAEYMSGRI